MEKYYIAKNDKGLRLAIRWDVEDLERMSDEELEKLLINRKWHAEANKQNIETHVRQLIEEEQYIGVIKAEIFKRDINMEGK